MKPVAIVTLRRDRDDSDFRKKTEGQMISVTPNKLVARYCSASCISTCQGMSMHNKRAVGVTHIKEGNL